VTGVRTTAHLVEDAVLERNRASRVFFAREAPALARASREMAARFLRGGRLLAFGRGPYLTDAQHVSVEFVHPVIVGKRALPALDLSTAFADWVPAIAQPDDMVMGFGPPAGDPAVLAVLDAMRSRGAFTFALPDGDGDDRGSAGGGQAHYGIAASSTDPFIHQEIVEILYHTLWETVHVFFEHRELGYDAGAAGFLYPFLGQRQQETSGVLTAVAESIDAKAQDVERLRAQVARDHADQIGDAAAAMRARLAAGGKLIIFGNGGSATDANDWALDCVVPPKPYAPIPAVSLAMEPANITAIANDIGPEAIFLRQLIAQARPHDVAVAISTSGGSANIIAALEEARKRGLLTVALLGYDGGSVVRRGLADFPLVVSSDYIPRIQEVQASIYHIVRDMLGVMSDG
jgi:D-sedoheptulose 7-phosphate isomerase